MKFFSVLILALSSTLVLAEEVNNPPEAPVENVVSLHCKSTDDVATNKFNGWIQMTINNPGKIQKAVFVIEVQKAGNASQKEIVTANNLYGKIDVYPAGSFYNQEVTFYNLRDDKDLPSAESVIRGQLTTDINHFRSSKISIGDWIYFSKCEN